MKTKSILGLGNLFRWLRAGIQHGELSYAPLSLRRVRLNGDRTGRGWLVRLPDAHEVQFRAFRQSAREPPGRMIAGKLRRDASILLQALPLTVRAKLGGFHGSTTAFCLSSAGKNNKVCGCSATDDPTRVLGGGGYGGK